MEDTMFADFESDMSLPFANFLTRTDGGKYWPELFSHRPIGYRPLTMNVTTPAGDGPHPLVIFIHGGAWWVGHPNLSNKLLSRLNIEETLLAAGYAVAKISYRLSSEAKFPKQLHDCKAAVRFLRENAEKLNLDPNRFAALGESAGGHLALLLGFVQNDTELEGNEGTIGFSSAVQCVVNWYGVTDLVNFVSQRPKNAISIFEEGLEPQDRLLGNSRAENLHEIQRVSPIYHIDESAPPVLIQHGTLDRLVPFGQAEALFDALSNAGRQVEFRPVVGGDHCFWGVEAENVMPQVVDFLNRTLGV